MHAYHDSHQLGHALWRRPQLPLGLLDEGSDRRGWGLASEGAADEPGGTQAFLQRQRGRSRVNRRSGPGRVKALLRDNAPICSLTKREGPTERFHSGMKFGSWILPWGLFCISPWPKQKSIAISPCDWRFHT